MLSYFLCALVVGAVCQNVEGKQLSSNKEIKMEPQCASQGGMCMRKADCPSGFESVIGSCPEQRQLGVVCCEGLPLSEVRCHRRGGECMSYCADKKFLITGAKDCPSSAPDCCLLI